MAAEALHRPGTGGGGQRAEKRLLGLVVAQLVELHVGAGLVYPGGIHRVLDQGVKHGRHEIHTEGAVHPVHLGQQAQGLGVALEVAEIGLHLAVQPLGQVPALVAQTVQVALEPVADDHLAEVAEGRIADVVKQSGAHDGVGRVPRLVLRHGVGGAALVFADIGGNHGGKLLGQRRGLHGVGQPGAHKVTLVQGKHLGLVLETAEGRAVDNPPVVQLKVVHRVFGQVVRDVQRFLPPGIQ